MKVRPLVLSLADLRRVSEKLMAHLEELGYDEISIPLDAYWHVPLRDSFDPEAKPTDLGLGSLEEDWDELEGLLGGNPRDPLVTDFRPLASILNALNRVVWELGEPQPAVGSAEEGKG